MNDSREYVSWRMLSVCPVSPKTDFLAGDDARQADRVDRLVDVATGFLDQFFVRIAVPLGESSLAGWCSSTISHSGMYLRGRL